MGLLDFAFNFSKGGGTSVPMSKSLMKFQSQQWRDNTQWFNQNGYKLLRDGLVAADYNPILAIGSSPLDGAMPTATASEPTVSGGMNWNGAAASQANTARKISDSQIMVNKSTANKLAEEALTQQNVRSNLDSQSLLNLLQSERIQKLLPYDVQKAVAEIAVLDSTANLNDTNAAYVPVNAETGRISANAAKKNADVNEQWAPSKLLIPALGALTGLGGFGLLTKGKNLWKGYKTANQIKKYKKLNNPNSYYKDFASTTVH